MALAGTSKIVAGAVCTGALGTTGVGCYYFLTQPTPLSIEKLIEKEHTDKTILDSTSKAKGLSVWSKYKNDNKDKSPEKDTWKIEGWPITNEVADEAPKGLIDACQNRKQTKVNANKDKEYLNFVNWCLVNKNS